MLGSSYVEAFVRIRFRALRKDKVPKKIASDPPKPIPNATASLNFISIFFETIYAKPFSRIPVLKPTYIPRIIIKVDMVNFLIRKSFNGVRSIKTFTPMARAHANAPNRKYLNLTSFLHQ